MRYLKGSTRDNSERSHSKERQEVDDKLNSQQETVGNKRWQRWMQAGKRQIANWDI